jgi:hypothetical protein
VFQGAENSYKRELPKEMKKGQPHFIACPESKFFS